MGKKKRKKKSKKEEELEEKLSCLKDGAGECYNLATRIVAGLMEANPSLPFNTASRIGKLREFLDAHHTNLIEWWIDA